ncbi:putative leucine-rich repeat domain superfamily [Helianthus anomalus]
MLCCAVILYIHHISCIIVSYYVVSVAFMYFGPHVRCTNNMNNLVLSIVPKFTNLRVLTFRKKGEQPLIGLFMLWPVVLKILNLFGCYKAATNKVLKAIGDNCRQLESINLGRCYEVGDAGVKNLAYG